MTNDTTKSVIQSEEKILLARQRLERKLRFAKEEPDSIFIVPFYKPGRFALVNMTRDMDRIIVAIKRKAGFVLPFDKAKEALQGLEEFITSLWGHVYKMTPRLHSFDRRRWRDLNDTPDEKVRHAYKNMSYPIVPRSEETGQVAMAVKIIENRNFEIRQTASFVEIEEAVKGYRKILEDFDVLLAGLAHDAEEEYKSPLGKFENEAQRKEEPATASASEVKRKRQKAGNND